MTPASSQLTVKFTKTSFLENYTIYMLHCITVCSGAESTLKVFNIFPIFFANFRKWGCNKKPAN